MQKADLLIIGSGPGGYIVAAEAAAKGLKVILVEKGLLGGTCLNRGCIPTKCLCASAERLNEIRTSSDFGIHVEGASADYAAVHARSRRVVDTLRSDVEALLEVVEVVHGEAVLESGKTVRVGENLFSADKIIIATGSRPAPLRVTGAEFAIDSDRVLALTELPEHVAIVGGGVIGLEFASIMAAFGCEVTVLEYCKEVLPGFDADIAKRLRSYLSRRGVKFVCNAKVLSISENHTVEFESKGKIKSLESDCVIAAVGRRPVIPDGYDRAGIELDERGFIAVDSSFRTSAEGIHAVGDVNGKCMLAHAATAQARIALKGNGDISAVPGVVFTNPECATVGMTAENAPEEYHAAEIKLPYGSNGKALASGLEDGMLKLVFSSSDGSILGCHAVGAHASDLIAEAAIAIAAKMTVDELAYGVIHAHPSMSELISEAANRAACTLK